ncbi:MAG: metallophosphoesterase [Chloracidobacterium sp.]|nr:metallophosphoesterase [Chloracidobacterium sp.]
MKNLILIGAILIGVFSANSFGQSTLITRNSVWKYLDNGSNQSTQWQSSNYNDSNWASGNSELGYGDGGETTTVSYGSDANNKYITTYFRKSFVVADPTLYSSLSLSLIRDDGVVVYLNGSEIYRSNMPAGTINYQTLAPVAIGGADESTFLQSTISPNLLVTGNNQLAVEIHQSAITSSDISFDLELLGQNTAPTAAVTRGPYLQMGNESSMTVRWRTDVPTNSQLRFGTLQGSLTSTVDDQTVITDHEIRVSGLQAKTKYYYSIGTTTQVMAGNDTNHFFITSPIARPSDFYRFWVLGDSGTATASARAVRDAYLSFNGSTYTNLVLMLGDNAYQSGTDAEYQAAVFDMYPTVLRQTPLWTTIGNHDTAQSSTPPSSLPYFQMFTLPTGTEGGGVASGTEKYYSFNYGNVHFVCLDSMTSNRSSTSPMLNWLREDLAQNSRPWLVAFWHHPPYTKGSHNSDTEAELIEMRTNVLPILELWGVDLVISGHSHSYERSYFIDGHYGNSTTFNNAMKKMPGGGRENIDGAYRKSYLSPHLANQGAVYAVAGSSGQISGGSLNHPAMFISLNNLGSMVIDVQNDRMNAKFLRENGTVADYFSIIKANPTAASTAIRGTVRSSNGSEMANVRLTITSPSGATRSAISSSFGTFQFDAVAIGETYVISANAKGYKFASRIFTVDDELADLEIIGVPQVGYQPPTSRDSKRSFIKTVKTHPVQSGQL